LCQQHGKRRLQVGWKTGERERLNLDRVERLTRSHHHRALAPPHLSTGLTQLVRQRQHVALVDALQNHLAAGNHRSDRERACLQPVRQYGRVEAVQPLDPCDADVRRADPIDARAHLSQHVAQRDDLRLGRGVDDRGRPTCKRGSHQQVFCARMARVVHVHVRALQTRRAHLVEAIAHMHGCPHALEAAHVHVNRAAAELAASRRRGRHLTGAGQDRARHEK
jgi:hypothetical protein